MHTHTEDHKCMQIHTALCCYILYVFYCKYHSISEYLIYTYLHSVTYLTVTTSVGYLGTALRISARQCLLQQEPSRVQEAEPLASPECMLEAGAAKQSHVEGMDSWLVGTMYICTW